LDQDIRKNLISQISDGKYYPLIALSKTQKEKPLTYMVEKSKNGYIAKSHQRYLEKGFIAYSLPSG